MAKEVRFSWKLAVLYSIGLTPAMAFFLFTRYKLKGYIDKSEWAIAIIVLLVGSGCIMYRAYLDHRKHKENKDE